MFGEAPPVLVRLLYTRWHHHVVAIISHNILQPPLHFQRYYYYIHKGIKKEMLSPTAAETMERVRSMIPHPLLEASHLQTLVQDLDGEVEQDYEYSVRKAIGE